MFKFKVYLDCIRQVYAIQRDKIAQRTTVHDPSSSIEDDQAQKPLIATV